MNIPFFKPKPFEPSFPIIPLLEREEDVLQILEAHGETKRKEPDNSDRTISQETITSESEHTRISVGIFNGKVRYTSYLTEHYDESEKKRGAKLAYFLQLHGGIEEFEEPWDNGYTIFWRNKKKKILIVFGLHCGPVRIIDENPENWKV
ncbi:hypothetical protein [Rubellicoccus peritrichatus]|uniref:Uncharacterized protein n=1 Tax=Rubellicoccus peritrichatus TaxID=3080537 RepID=A0AAQ3LGB6_9BACT|nr:hypothetical protein [Puniceicoccus sp. CR14]WOO43318.1 hypothetical protein RZN69_09470 [Puniceicoccus sp. CR14]